MTFSMMLSKYRFLLLSCSLVLISSSMMYAYSWGRRERTLAREYLSVATRADRDQPVDRHPVPAVVMFLGRRSRSG